MANTLDIQVSDTDHLSGRGDASLQLVEYGDFQCPYCGEAYWDVKRIQEDLGDELAFVFREFPLTQSHRYAFGRGRGRRGGRPAGAVLGHARPPVRAPAAACTRRPS